MKQFIRPAVLLIVFAAVAAVILSYNARYERRCTELEGADKREFYFECVVSEFPIVKDNTVRLYCTIKNTDFPFGSSYKLLVKLPAKLSGEATIGSVLKFTSPVQVPDTAMNYGSFSYRNYLKSKNTLAIAEPEYSSVSITNENNSLTRYMYDLRRRVVMNIERYFSGNECALMKAILTGDRETMSEDMFDSYKKTGIYHIVAVSGLHAGIFVALLSGLLSKLPMRRRKRNLIIRGSSIIIAVLLLMFTGYGVSVMRVISMLAILLVSVIVHRKYSVINSLLCAAVILLLAAPYQIFSLSFQLSFLSTLGLCVALKIFRIKARILDESDYIATSLVISAGSFIATFCVSVYSFGLVSFASLLANIVIIPLATFLLTSLIGFCALSFVLPTNVLSVIKYIPLLPARIINSVSDIIAKIPFSSAKISLYDVAWIFTLLLPIAASIYFLHRKKRLMIILTAAILAANGILTLHSFTDNDVKVSFLNTGKGECTVISDGREKIVVDCGSASSKNTADDIIEPYMRHNGVRRIDKLFISYFDKEHTNAVNKLMYGGYIKEIVIPPTSNIQNENVLLQRRKILHTAKVNNVKVTQIHAGYPIKATDSVTVSVYSDDNLELKDKNGCAVYQLDCGKTSFVLASCLGAKGQELLSKTMSNCDVLKIPSYGVPVKISGKFIHSFNPKYAVITAPPRNNYYKFDRKMSELLTNQRIKYARTDINKTITFVTDGTKIKSISASEGEFR